MSLLPPSTNADYRGSIVSVWFSALAGVLTIVAGLIHYFLPDGGAGTIAHIDLTTRADTMIAIFAWYGAMRIPFGILILIIALRYRSLVPLVLLLLFIMQALSAFLRGSGKRPTAVTIRPSMMAAPSSPPFVRSFSSCHCGTAAGTPSNDRKNPTRMS